MGKVRRQKGAVVSDDAAVTPVVDVPNPPAGLDLFAKFQSKRNDFEGEWVLMEEGEPIGAVAPLGEAVKQRLKDHQGVFAKGRGGERTGTAPHPSPSADAGAVRSSSSDDDEDDEYDPGEVAAAAPHDAEEEEAQRRKADGIQGDYLSFAKKKTEQLTTADLTVSIDNPNRQPHPSSSSAASQRGRRSPVPHHRAEDGDGDGASSSATLTYPLWSARRVRELGGYLDPERYPTIALHQEVMDLIDFLRPTQAEISLRRFIEMEIRRMAQKLWPECEVLVYGSLSTGLILPLSDVDMTISNVPVSTEEALTLLAKEIDAARFTDGAYPQVILKTKVPLVKFKHAGSLIDVDISIGALDGRENTRIVQELLVVFPEARPLIILIKYFLQQRDMNEPYHGGLGSYSTVLLVISFLQHHPIYTTRPEERPFTGLGKLLVDFFRYVGLYWDYHRCGVSVRNGGSYYRRGLHSPYASSPTTPNSPRSPAGPTQMEIEDPGNPTNNTASSVRQFNVISSLFTHAYCALTANEMPLPGSSTSPPAASPEAQDIALRPTLLSRILHVDGDSVQSRRRIESTYQQLCEEIPKRMAEVRAYCHAEDEPLLTGKPPRPPTTTSSSSSQKDRGPFSDTTERSGEGEGKYRKGGATGSAAGALERLRASSVDRLTAFQRLELEQQQSPHTTQLQREVEGRHRRIGTGHFSRKRHRSDESSTSVSASSSESDFVARQRDRREKNKSQAHASHSRGRRHSLSPSSSSVKRHRAEQSPAPETGRCFMGMCDSDLVDRDGEPPLVSSQEAGLTNMLGERGGGGGAPICTHMNIKRRSKETLNATALTTNDQHQRTRRESSRNGDGDRDAPENISCPRPAGLGEHGAAAGPRRDELRELLTAAAGAAAEVIGGDEFAWDTLCFCVLVFIFPFGSSLEGCLYLSPTQRGPPPFDSSSVVEYHKEGGTPLVGDPRPSSHSLSAKFLPTGGRVFSLPFIHPSIHPSMPDALLFALPIFSRSLPFLYNVWTSATTKATHAHFTCIDFPLEPYIYIYIYLLKASVSACVCAPSIQLTVSVTRSTASHVTWRRIPPRNKRTSLSRAGRFDPLPDSLCLVSVHTYCARISAQDCSSNQQGIEILKRLLEEEEADTESEIGPPNPPGTPRERTIKQSKKKEARHSKPAERRETSSSGCWSILPPTQQKKNVKKGVAELFFLLDKQTNKQTNNNNNKKKSSCMQTFPIPSRASTLLLENSASLAAPPSARPLTATPPELRQVQGLQHPPQLPSTDHSAECDGPATPYGLSPSLLVASPSMTTEEGGPPRRIPASSGASAKRKRKHRSMEETQHQHDTTWLAGQQQPLSTSSASTASTTRGSAPQAQVPAGAVSTAAGMHPLISASSTPHPVHAPPPLSDGSGRDPNAAAVEAEVQEMESTGKQRRRQRGERAIQRWLQDQMRLEEALLRQALRLQEDFSSLNGSSGGADDGAAGQPIPAFPTPPPPLPPPAAAAGPLPAVPAVTGAGQWSVPLQVLLRDFPSAAAAYYAAATASMPAQLTPTNPAAVAAMPVPAYVIPPSPFALPAAAANDDSAAAIQSAASPGSGPSIGLQPLLPGASLPSPQACTADPSSEAASAQFELAAFPRAERPRDLAATARHTSGGATPTAEVNAASSGSAALSDTPSAAAGREAHGDGAPPAPISGAKSNQLDHSSSSWLGNSSVTLVVSTSKGVNVATTIPKPRGRSTPRTAAQAAQEKNLRPPTAPEKDGTPNVPLPPEKGRPAPVEATERDAQDHHHHPPPQPVRTASLSSWSRPDLAGSRPVASRGTTPLVSALTSQQRARRQQQPRQRQSSRPLPPEEGRPANKTRSGAGGPATVDGHSSNELLPAPSGTSLPRFSCADDEGADAERAAQQHQRKQEVRRRGTTTASPTRHKKAVQRRTPPPHPRPSAAPADPSPPPGQSRRRLPPPGFLCEVHSDGSQLSHQLGGDTRVGRMRRKEKSRRTQRRQRIEKNDGSGPLGHSDTHTNASSTATESSCRGATPATRSTSASSVLTISSSASGASCLHHRHRRRRHHVTPARCRPTEAVALVRWVGGPTAAAAQRSAGQKKDGGRRRTSTTTSQPHRHSPLPPFSPPGAEALEPSASLSRSDEAGEEDPQGYRSPAVGNACRIQQDMEHFRQLEAALGVKPACIAQRPTSPPPRPPLGPPLAASPPAADDQGLRDSSKASCPTPSPSPSPSSVPRAASSVASSTMAAVAARLKELGLVPCDERAALQGQTRSSAGHRDPPQETKKARSTDKSPPQQTGERSAASAVPFAIILPPTDAAGQEPAAASRHPTRHGNSTKNNPPFPSPFPSPAAESKATALLEEERRWLEGRLEVIDGWLGGRRPQQLHRDAKAEEWDANEVSADSPRPGSRPPAKPHRQHHRPVRSSQGPPALSPPQAEDDVTLVGPAGAFLSPAQPSPNAIQANGHPPHTQLRSASASAATSSPSPPVPSDPTVAGPPPSTAVSASAPGRCPGRSPSGSSGSPTTWLPPRIAPEPAPVPARAGEPLARALRATAAALRAASASPTRGAPLPTTTVYSPIPPEIQRLTPAAQDLEFARSGPRGSVGTSTRAPGVRPTAAGNQPPHSSGHSATAQRRLVFGAKK
eukprot:gene2237-1399_t